MVRLRKSFICLLIFMGLVLAACRNGATETEVPPTPSASPTATSRPAATPTASPTATSSPTPEPPAPAVEASDQPLTESGKIIIDYVVALAPGWVVLSSDSDGQPDRVLGYAPIATGRNEEVEITIDPYAATSRLHATLHRDEGQTDEFEFPGADSVIEVEDEAVGAIFEVDIQVVLPALTVADQEVTTAGQIVVGQVVAPEGGWLVVHADQEGQPGSILGQTALTAGEQENVVVLFDWHQATPRLHAVLYLDAGQPGVFEAPDPDRPVTIGGTVLSSPFNVTLPPDVFVLNQPVIDNTLVVERVVVNDPTWLVAYTDANGTANLIIGQVLLEAGISENVVVPVDGRLATPVLHLLLHPDVDTAGEFDFPRGDLALRYNDRLQMFSLRTNAGNYLITRDQPISEDNTVVVPLVVTDVPAWVIVQADIEGIAGTMLGRTWVPPGVSRDVVVEVEPAGMTDRVFVTLYFDAGTAQEFEYPDGPDVPLQRNRGLIQSPFRVLAAEAE